VRGISLWNLLFHSQPSTILAFGIGIFAKMHELLHETELFHRDTFREIPRLINVAFELQSAVIGK